MSFHIRNKILQTLQQDHLNDIGIAMHTGPDGDSIGSAVALEEALTLLGKNVTIICHSKISNNYKDIIGDNRVNKIIIPPKDKVFDIIILVDCSQPERTVNNIESMCKFLITIDHHYDCDPFGDIYLYENESSTGIIIYKIIKKIVNISPKIATALYLTIRSDTGSFKNNNTNNISHKVAGELLDNGADIKLINRIYDDKSLTLLRLMGFSFKNIIFNKNNKIAYLIITQDYIQKSGSSYEEASQLIDYIRSIKGIDISYLFLVSNNQIIIKGRSKETDVSKILKKFNGGGHKHAAAAMIYSDNYFESVHRVISYTKECMNNKEDR